MPGRAPTQRTGKREQPGAGSTGSLGIEQTLWAAADKLRGNLDAAEYKHVVLGLIFLKYIFDAFEEQLHAKLISEESEGADPEHPDEYRAARVVDLVHGRRGPQLTR